MTAEIIEFPRRHVGEVDKRTLAAILGRSLRWVNYRLAEGMPSRWVGDRRMFRVPEVRGWLREQGYMEGAA